VLLLRHVYIAEKNACRLQVSVAIQYSESPLYIAVGLMSCKIGLSTNF